MSSKGIGHDGFKSKVIGKLIPIRDHILLTDMEFGERKLGMFVLPSDDGKSEGVRHRWGRVWAIGPEQKDVKVGEWILLEHGRWTRGVTVVEEDGSEIIIRRADLNGILMVSDGKPDEKYMNTYGAHSKVQHQEWDPASFASPSFEQ
jgi:co-chaperonin GroES (HSP10)